MRSARPRRRSRRPRRRSPPQQLQGRDRQARRSRLRHPHGRVAHSSGGRRRRRRCRRCCRRSPSTPTATSAIARWSCSPASTIRARRTRCASRWPARTIACATVAYSFFEHNPDRALLPRAAGRARQGAGRVRPAGAGPRARGARRGDDPRVRQALLRDVGRGEDFFRSAVIEALGDYKARVRLRRAHRHREARRPAAGRRGAGAGQDRRQARARDAGGAAADGAAADAAVDRRGDLPARRQLRVARELSDRDAEVRRQEPRLPGAAARRRRRPRRARRRRATPRRSRRCSTIGIPSRRSDARAGRAGARRRSRCATRR